MFSFLRKRKIGKTKEKKMSTPLIFAEEIGERPLERSAKSKPFFSNPWKKKPSKKEKLLKKLGRKLKLTKKQKLKDRQMAKEKKKQPKKTTSPRNSWAGSYMNNGFEEEIMTMGDQQNYECAPPLHACEPPRLPATEEVIPDVQTNVGQNQCLRQIRAEVGQLREDMKQVLEILTRNTEFSKACALSNNITLHLTSQPVASSYGSLYADMVHPDGESRRGSGFTSSGSRDTLFSFRQQDLEESRRDVESWQINQAFPLCGHSGDSSCGVPLPPEMPE